jgi:hypothetical protein
VTRDDGKTSVIRHYVLADALTSICNKVLLGRQYPPEWEVGVVVPVPKKGDLSSMDSYRGITVGSAISKVYALVILARLDAWAEKQQFRAATQFGFRKGMSTIDAIFTMRHTIELYEQQHKPVFAAFIDFRKAYDRVDRNLLWKCLQNLGVHGECLETLQNMYRVVDLRVRVDGNYGEVFQSTVGVKQGDPLSPLLFGLLIDQFEGFIARHAPWTGVNIAGRRVRVLFYADDLVILAESDQHLQQALDCLGSFCEASNLAVNTDKSEVVVFNSKHNPNQRRLWTYKGNRMTVSNKYTYLGVELSDKSMQKQMIGAKKGFANKGNRCCMAMMSQCTAIRCHNPHILARLFDALVLPVMSYGAEVWGPDVLNHERKRTNACDASVLSFGEAETVHRLFMRMTLRVNKATPVACMMHEMRRSFIATSWLRGIGRFWNKMATAGQDNIMNAILRENYECVENGWARHVESLLQCRGIHIRRGGDMIHPIEQVGTVAQSWNDDCMENIGWKHAHIARNAAEAQCVTGCIVRDCPDEQHTGFKAMRYLTWFALEHTRGDSNPCERDFCCMTHKPSHVRAIAQFRLGVHWLMVEKGRAMNMKRSARLCMMCDSNTVEDEVHAMICPAMNGVRHRFPALFDTDDYREVCSAVLDNPSGIDCLFKNYINGEGYLFWQQLGDYLIVSQKIHS